jgi:hypothetical protein
LLFTLLHGEPRGDRSSDDGKRSEVAREELFLLLYHTDFEGEQSIHCPLGQKERKTLCRKNQRDVNLAVEGTSNIFENGCDTEVTLR